MSATAARLLRDARRRQGLTQADLARHAGTSQSAVSAYESGRKDPSVETLGRLLAAAGAMLEAVPAPEDMRAFLAQSGFDDLHSASLADAARRIREGEDTWVAVREFLDGVGLSARLLGPDGVAALLGEPDRTGDARVDALLGALAEHLATVHGVERPGWCIEPMRFLRRWWFPHRRRAFDAVALRDAPAAFRRRGIFLHPSALERV